MPSGNSGPARCPTKESSRFSAGRMSKETLIAESEEESTHSGWAPTPKELPGTWPKNPVGEQTIAYARVLVDGRFNENEKGLATEIEDGDRVALVYPFMFCC